MLGATDVPVEPRAAGLLLPPLSVQCVVMRVLIAVSAPVQCGSRRGRVCAVSLCSRGSRRGRMYLCGAAVAAVACAVQVWRRSPRSHVCFSVVWRRSPRSLCAVTVACPSSHSPCRVRSEALYAPACLLIDTFSLLLFLALLLSFEFLLSDCERQHPASPSGSCARHDVHRAMPSAAIRQDHFLGLMPPVLVGAMFVTTSNVPPNTLAPLLWRLRPSAQSLPSPKCSGYERAE